MKSWTRVKVNIYERINYDLTGYYYLFFYIPWEAKHVSTHTWIRTRKVDRGAELVGWVGSWSHLIGWLSRSQLGVVLQDDLQLLTQHDVPSNLQLAREERLKRERHTCVIFQESTKSPLIFSRLVVFKCMGSKKGPRRLWLTLHTNEKATNQVLGKWEYKTIGALAADQWNNIHIYKVQLRGAGLFIGWAELLMVWGLKSITGRCVWGPWMTVSGVLSNSTSQSFSSCSFHHWRGWKRPRLRDPRRCRRVCAHRPQINIKCSRKHINSVQRWPLPVTDEMLRT